MKMKTLILPPERQLQSLLSPMGRALLEQSFEVYWNLSGADYPPEQLAALLPQAQVILTGPDTPPLSPQALAKAENLAWWIHAGGSIKSVAPESVFDRGVRCFTAKGRRAATVGEWCLGSLLALLRQINAHDSDMHLGYWNELPAGRELFGATVGIVAASATARAFIALLAPFQCRVLLYDPYLSIPQANALGIKIASLQEVMACPIVSLHAPCLPLTEGMITGELLQLMPDGAVLLNSADARLVDGQALMQQLASGRISAALDVYDKEPLPANHSLRNLKNVLLTPRIAGDSAAGRQEWAQAAVEDALTAMEGLPVTSEVTRDTWPIID